MVVPTINHEVPGSYVLYFAHPAILGLCEAVKDLGDGLARCFGGRDYPEVRVKCSLEDFDDQKALAIGEPSQIVIELGANLDVDLFNPPGAPTGTTIGIPGSAKCADRPRREGLNVAERRSGFPMFRC